MNIRVNIRTVDGGYAAALLIIDGVESGTLALDAYFSDTKDGVLANVRQHYPDANVSENLGI